MDIEEQFFCQKSRIQWLKYGDQNTNYFHKIVQDKAAKNAIKRLIATSEKAWLL